MRAAFLMVSTLLCALALPAQRPNFTGIWQLDTTKSKLTIPTPPVTSTFIFIHNGDNWHMERTHFFPDPKQVNTIQFDRVIGGHPDTKKDDGDVTISRMFWEGSHVVLDQQMSDADNNHGSNHVVYTLTADGTQLTALEHEEFPDGNYTNAWVFDRVTPPKMNVTFPSTGLSDAALESLKKVVLRDNTDCDPKDAAFNIDYALADLGKRGPGVIVRSKRPCDCGATRNCNIYVYERRGNAFSELPFSKDDVPTGWAFGVGTLPSGDLFFAVGSNAGGGMQTETFYQFFRDRFHAVGSQCLPAKNADGHSAGWFDPAKVHRISCSIR